MNSHFSTENRNFPRSAHHFPREKPPFFHPGDAEDDADSAALLAAVPPSEAAPASSEATQSAEEGRGEAMNHA